MTRRILGGIPAVTRHFIFVYAAGVGAGSPSTHSAAFSEKIAGVPRFESTKIRHSRESRIELSCPVPVRYTAPMLKTVALVALGLVAILAGVVAMQPDTFHFERSTVIEAPPAFVFPYINDFHRWSSWSPWEKLDPDMKRTFDGPPAGVDAKYAWVGNKDVGQGRMTILESRPPEHVVVLLEFLEPFEATNQAIFHMEAPTARSTHLTWTMEGKSNFVSKAIGLVVSLDKVLGKDFDDGLASLKRLAEAEAGKGPAAAPPP
jgi:hypothetical protein